MKPTKSCLSLLVVLFSFVTPSFANATEKQDSGKVAHDSHAAHGEEGHGTHKFNAQEFILHHVSDAHDFHIYGEGANAIHFHLPIILIDGGLVVFSSGKFTDSKQAIYINDDTTKVAYDTTHYTVTTDGKYALHHEKMYKTENGILTFDKEGYPNQTHPLDFSITKNVFSLLLSAIILLLVFMRVGAAYKKKGLDSAPKGLQSFMEPLILLVRDEIAKPNIGEKKYRKYMPYLLTIFFFIWVNNLIGLVPFFPGSSNLSGNIAFTLVLAVITYLVTTFSGNKDYWKHLLMPPVPKALWILMIPIELVGTLTKPFALMIRLFANITAGHIVVLSFICIIFTNQAIGWAGMSVPMALFIGVLELLVAFLQAFVFTMLSALFIGGAVEEHEHH